MSCGVGRRRGSDPVLLWLWHRLVASALIRPLAWEAPYAAGAALEKAKRRKKKVYTTQFYHPVNVKYQLLGLSLTFTENCGTNCFPFPFSSWKPSVSPLMIQTSQPLDISYSNSLCSTSCHTFLWWHLEWLYLQNQRVHFQNHLFFYLSYTLHSLNLPFNFLKALDSSTLLPSLQGLNVPLDFTSFST